MCADPVLPGQRILRLSFPNHPDCIRQLPVIGERFCRFSALMWNLHVSSYGDDMKTRFVWRLIVAEVTRAMLLPSLNPSLVIPVSRIISPYENLCPTGAWAQQNP